MENKFNITHRLRLKRTVKKQVDFLLESGYKEITEADMWEYLLTYRWKKDQPKTIALMKEDILKVTANNYFDYQQLKAITKNKFEDLDQLL